MHDVGSEKSTVFLSQVKRFYDGGFMRYIAVSCLLVKYKFDVNRTFNTASVLYQIENVR